MKLLPQRTSSKGIDFLIAQEGVVRYAYNDPAGHATFGVGHLLHLGRVTLADEKKWGSKAHPMPMKKVKATLKSDLKKYEAAVRKSVGRRLPQHQFDACVSLCFNIGINGFSSSSVARILRTGAVGTRAKLATEAFMLWDNPKMLVPRRKREQKLFYEGVYR